MTTRSEVNAAMRNLSEIIWKEGGFRFRHTATNGENYTYQYRCSQDIMHAKSYQSTAEGEKQRDGRRMARFPCQSKLNIRPLYQIEPFRFRSTTSGMHLTTTLNCRQWCKNRLSHACQPRLHQKYTVTSEIFLRGKL